VYASPARLLRKRRCYCEYEHCGSQEATTAGHHRMVVRGCLMWSDRALLIFVIVKSSVEGSR
jgi:hypothetical protein